MTTGELAQPGAIDAGTAEATAKVQSAFTPMSDATWLVMAARRNGKTTLKNALRGPIDLGPVHRDATGEPVTSFIKPAVQK